MDRIAGVGPAGRFTRPADPASASSLPNQASMRRADHQPKPAPMPTELSESLNAPPTVTVARSLIARW